MASGGDASGSTFMATQLVRGKVSHALLADGVRHAVSGAMAKDMHLQNTVDQVHVLSTQMDVVGQRKGRTQQGLHRGAVVGWCVLGIGVLAAAAILIWLLLLKPNRGCAADTDCAAHAFCVLPRGTDGAPMPHSRGVCSAPYACTVGGDECPSGSACLSGMCQPSSCVSDADCRSGGAVGAPPVHCSSSSHTCQLGCASDADCGAGSLCVAGAHDGDPPRCVWGACRQDIDCANTSMCGALAPNPATTPCAALMQYAACTQATTCLVPKGASQGTCHIPCGSGGAGAATCGKFGMACSGGGTCEAITCGDGTSRCPSGTVCQRGTCATTFSTSSPCAS